MKKRAQKAEGPAAQNYGGSGALPKIVLPKLPFSGQIGSNIGAVDNEKLTTALNRLSEKCLQAKDKVDQQTDAERALSLNSLMIEMLGEMTSLNGRT